TGWLRAAVRKAVIVADPGAFEDKKVNAQASARVELWETPDDTANLAGCDLPLGEASRAFNRITAIAAALKTDGDPRPLDYVRALVFQALLLGQDPFLGVVLDPPPGPGDPADGAPAGPGAGQDECPAGTSTGTQTGTPTQVEAGAQDRTGTKTAANSQVSAAVVNAKTLAKIHGA